jgi:hypothetical protein
MCLNRSPLTPSNYVPALHFGNRNQLPRPSRAHCAVLFSSFTNFVKQTGRRYIGVVWGK